MSDKRWPSIASLASAPLEDAGVRAEATSILDYVADLEWRLSEAVKQPQAKCLHCKRQVSLLDPGVFRCVGGGRG